MGVAFVHWVFVSPHFFLSSAGLPLRELPCLLHIDDSPLNVTSALLTRSPRRASTLPSFLILGHRPRARKGGRGAVVGGERPRLIWPKRFPLAF
ncbi:hypothetical protein DFJ73DRAFT_839212 [Zopfochytrium polystomum]|nr:hypothetical protein DFJ73DRAFT_878962 [Zopfochytrium polystomum]KAI9345471.1 hypothetical protein DFJ73DRAFT_839212 [Zopfochytrium polystomum]